MEDLVKKFVYTGVGLVSLTAEKLQESLDKLVDDEKISSAEGKKVVDEFVNTTDEKRSEFEEKLKAIAEEVIETFRFSKAKEVEELKNRVAALEAKLGVTAEVATEEKKKPETKKKPAAKKVEVKG